MVGMNSKNLNINQKTKMSFLSSHNFSVFKAESFSFFELMCWFYLELLIFKTFIIISSGVIERLWLYKI